MASIEHKDVDIYLLGSGTRSFLDLTVWTQHLLCESCKKVFFLHDLPSFEKYLQKLNPQSENLRPLLYLDGRIRSEVYQDIVNHVVGACEQLDKNHRPVGLLLHGHPLVFSTISEKLIQSCRERNLNLEIVPAVSCLDSIFVDLKLDIGKDGIQIYGAGAILAKKIPLNPSSGVLLLQVKFPNCPVAHQELTPEENDILELKNYLLRTYPGEHRAILVESSVELGFDSKVLELKLGELEKGHANFTYNASIYIPPLPG